MDKGLRIHTSMQPAAEKTPPKTPDKRHFFPHARKAKARKEDAKNLELHTHLPEREIKESSAEIARKRSPAERLFRNTTVACALLLTVIALRNIDTPFTRSVTEALTSAISMDVNLEDTLGKLSFVERLMPESALVFLNMESVQSVSLPVSGQILHEYTDSQPWTEYLTEDASCVYALKDGTVSACAESTEGDWTVLVTHSDGTQAVYAYLAEVGLAPGDQVERGKSIGVTGTGENAHLYFEYRVDMEPSNPKTVLSEANP